MLNSLCFSITHRIAYLRHVPYLIVQLIKFEWEYQKMKLTMARHPNDPVLHHAMMTNFLVRMELS